MVRALWCSSFQGPFRRYLCKIGGQRPVSSQTIYSSNHTHSFVRAQGILSPMVSTKGDKSTNLGLIVALCDRLSEQ